MATAGKQPGKPARGKGANDGSNPFEDGLADERTHAAQESEHEAIREIAEGKDPATDEGVDAIISGASPDDAALMRNWLGLPKPPGRPRKTSDELADDWRDGGYPYKYKILRKDYEREKFILQTELLKLQSWMKESQQRLMILFEGRDAAGKGGTIKRFMEHLNPRGARVVALEKPSEV
jgi:hypothetical protein